MCLFTLGPLQAPCGLPVMQLNLSSWPSLLAVCPEPKVFVGQMPLEAGQEQITQLFSQYGNVKHCVVITHPDGRSKGAAMVLYDRWSEAELAIEGENGKSSLGGTKPLVVRMADPPKRGDGPVCGIAPKKLFVGQVRVEFRAGPFRALLLQHGLAWPSEGWQARDMGLCSYEGSCGVGRRLMHRSRLLTATTADPSDDD